MAEFKLELKDTPASPPLTLDLSAKARDLLSRLGSNQQSEVALGIVSESLKSVWVEGWRTSRALDGTMGEAAMHASSTPCPRCGGSHARMA